ncbi:MAG: SHOCT domain-containing protein [Actinobacteria bacterium]|nr:SHOCT domain-containing protein [Actinomycetota bacterium]
MMGGWYAGGMSAGSWLFMGVFWVALLGLILYLVVRLLPSGGRGTPAGRETPEEILSRRFARGEIDVETYQAQRATLTSARGER